MSVDASLVLIAVGWMAGWILAGRDRALPPCPEGEAITVSVVVPARDEEGSLPHLLARLAAASPAPTEVLVVDDGSSDATAALAVAAGCRVLTVDPPDGWTGKAWACWQGAQAAGGQILVFLDADTEPGPRLVADLASAANSYGGLVSVQPWHDVERPYEQLSAFCNLVAVAGAGTGRRPVAFGPAMAVPKAHYVEFGGHAAVRGRVAEDLALARVAESSGIPVMAFGRGDIRYRMYPEGVGQLVEGWSKNLAVGAGSLSPLRLLLVVLWISACLQAALLPVSARWSIPALVAYGLVAAQLGVLWRRVGRFGLLAAALFPIPVFSFVALFVRSMWLTKVRRRVRWRGRMLEPA